MFQSRPLDQKAGNDPVDRLQQRRKQLRLSGQQKAQRNRQREHPLAHRDRRDHAIDQMGGGFRHAPGAARRAKAAPLAKKRDQLLMGAVAAAQAEKPVREDAAFEKGIEFGFDKLR